MKRTPLKRKPFKRKVKVKKPSITSLKSKADKVFSIYIRTKYSKDGFGACYTCGKILEFKKTQCGHFVSRVYLATRYDERNCRIQCAGCNIWGHGKPVEFAAKLEEEMPGIVSILYEQAKILQPNFDYQNIINRYAATSKEAK